MNVFHIVSAIGWKPGIGDPTLMGWLTVAAYFATALLCLASAHSAGRIYSGEGLRQRRRLWLGFAVIFLLLGANKQLDLLSGLTALFSAVARNQAWYESRKTIQIEYIAAVVVTALVSLFVVRTILRDIWRQYWLALLGSVLLLAFVVVRASSYHLVDRFINLRLVGIRMNWIVELGLIACVGVVATLSLIRQSLLLPVGPANSQGQS